MRIVELQTWNGCTTLLLDGGDGPRARPPIHVQAGSERQLRLVGPDGVVLSGVVFDDHFGIEIVRGPARVPVLPPLRASEMDTATDWVRHFAQLLLASPCTPLAVGRRMLLASLETAGVPVPTWHVDLDIEDLRQQQVDFDLRWDIGHVWFLLTRPLSDDADGRVKMWRKCVREGRLPPVLVWWNSGFFAHIVLDGHDRLLAALLEGKRPPFVVLGDVVPRSTVGLAEDREVALERAELVARFSGSNAVLQAAWDPRTEWCLATPGFPLE